MAGDWVEQMVEVRAVETAAKKVAGKVSDLVDN